MYVLGHAAVTAVRCGEQALTKRTFSMQIAEANAFGQICAVRLKIRCFG